MLPMLFECSIHGIKVNSIPAPLFQQFDHISLSDVVMYTFPNKTKDILVVRFTHIISGI